MMQIRQQQLQLHQQSTRGSTINDGVSSPSTTMQQQHRQQWQQPQQQPRQQPYSSSCSSSSSIGDSVNNVLFNSFLLQGSTPDDFSLGFWSAIPKSSAPALKHAVSNKRPISRSSAVGKLFEAVIRRRIREQIEIVDVQGGFTPGRSGLDNMVWLWETLSVLKHDKRYNYRLHLFDFVESNDKTYAHPRNYGTSHTRSGILRPMRKQQLAERESNMRPSLHRPRDEQRRR